MDVRRDRHTIITVSAKNIPGELPVWLETRDPIGQNCCDWKLRACTGRRLMGATGASQACARRMNYLCRAGLGMDLSDDFVKRCANLNE